MKSKITLLFTVMFSFMCFTLSSQQYKISEVKYNITGNTKEIHLKKSVPIDTDIIFSSQDELNDYLNEIKQQFINLRVFSQVALDYENSDMNDEIQNVLLTVTVTDSSNFIVLPYYKYDSNDGHVLKAKLKDSNFLGTLNEASSDVYVALDQGENDSLAFKFGASFENNFPFYMGIIEASWNNNLDFSYTIGKDTPEWLVDTGFKFRLPFENLALELTLSQKFVNDFDYEVFNDALYFGEFAEFSVPIILEKFTKYGNLIYTPGVNYTYNWSYHELNQRNDDLLSPELLFFNRLAMGRINWIGNFRKGFEFYVKQEAGYNFHINKMVIGAEGQLQWHTHWKQAGINARLYGFSYINKNKTIGHLLRGIRDEEFYNNSSNNDINSTSTPAAIVLNLDFPIKLFTTDFEKIGLNFLRKLNFELQIAPFIDFAISENRVTGRKFDIKDSYMCAGLEVIVFPVKWNALQIRASVGFDLGSLLLKDYIDTSWRPDVSIYEIAIGIGLHY